MTDVQPYAKPKPMTEENPYQMAVWLEGLIRAAKHVADDVSDGRPELGLNPLMDVIHERAQKLSEALDWWAFCDGWPDVEAALEKDDTFKELLKAAAK